MRKISVWLLAVAFALVPRFVMAADKGLHLGRLEKDSKKAKIEARRFEQQTQKEARAKKKQFAKEIKKKHKHAEKAMKKAEKEAQEGFFFKLT